MGIFGGKNRVTSQSSTTTLIAEGCHVDGYIKVANKLQVDGRVEGHVEVAEQLKISKSGSVTGEIITERLIINGDFEGICHATYIEILSCGRVSGTVYSDNLSIETGGKFLGVTNPSDETLLEQKPEKEKKISKPEMISSEEEHKLTDKMTLLSSDLLS